MNRDQHTGKKTHEEKRMAIVLALSAVTMLLEVGIGWFAGSMALLADGIHMAAHVVVIGVALGAYVLVRRLQRKRDNPYNCNKILNLAAYTSGIMLLLFALFIVSETLERGMGHVHNLKFNEAITVAIIGLVVNGLSATMLHDKHGHDLNQHSAYLHVLADTLTSTCTIVALLAAKLWGITWLDSLVAIVCAIIIMRWAVGLLKRTARSLACNADDKVA